MLDAPARALERIRIRAESALVDIEHQAIATVSNGMRGHLGIRGPGALQDSRELVGLCKQEAVTRCVRVVRQQCRAARSERAIDVELDSPNMNQAGRIVARTFRQDFIGVLHVQVVVDTDGEFARLRELLEDGHVLARRAHVVNRCPAPCGVEHDGTLERFAPAGVGEHRKLRAYPLHRAVDEHAGRRAGSVAQYLPTGRIDTLCIDPSQCERTAVGNRRVPIRTLQ